MSDTPFELSEKSRPILTFQIDRVDQELLQVFSIIIDDEGEDWSDHSGVSDLETYVLGSPYKLGGRYNKYLVEQFLKWSATRLPRTAAALFSVLDPQDQHDLTDHFVLNLAQEFAAVADSESDLKTAARMVRTLSQQLEPSKSSIISPRHRTCEVAAAVVYKLNKIHPFSVEMSDIVRRSVSRDLPELQKYSSRFPQFLALEHDLVRSFIRTEGKGIRVDASLMHLFNDRFDAMLASTGTKIPLGSNMVAVLEGAKMLLRGANHEPDAYRYESHMRQPDKAVAMVLATLEAPAKLLRLSFLNVGSEGSMRGPFKKLMALFSDVHQNLVLHGCTQDRLNAGYTNLFAAAVTAFGNATYKKDVGLELQHDFLNQLYPHIDFDQVQKKASAGGRSIFADYIRAHHPERTQDLTLQQQGRIFTIELGV